MKISDNIAKGMLNLVSNNSCFYSVFFASSDVKWIFNSKSRGGHGQGMTLYKWFNFGVVLDPDVYLRSVLHFPLHCQIWFLRYVVTHQVVMLQLPLQVRHFIPYIFSHHKATV